MRGSRVPFALLVLLTVAAPAMAEVVQGSLRAESVTATEATLLATGNPLVVARSPVGAIEFAIDGAVGELTRTWAPVVAVDGPLFPGTEVRHVAGDQASTEVVRLAGASIVSVGARADAVAFATGEGSATLALAPAGPVTFTASEPTTVLSRPDYAVQTGDAFATYLHARDVEVRHVNATVPEGVATLEGPMELYLFSLDFEVNQGGEARVYRTGFATERDGGFARGERVEKAVLTLTAGRLMVRTLDPLEFRAPEGTVDAGSALLADASGSLRADSAAYVASGDVRLHGAALALAPSPDAAGLAVAVAGDTTLIGFTVLQDPRALLDDDRAAAVGAAAGGGLLLLAIVGAVAYRRRHPRAKPEGLVEEAVLRLEAGDFAAALALFNEAVAREPRNPTLHLDRAQCLDKLGKKSEARRAFETAVRLAPENGEAHYHLARSLASTGLAPSAIAHLSRAFSLDPAFAQAAREDAAFTPLRDHPSYQELDGYYIRAT